MFFTLLFLKALETSNLGDQSDWVNVFPKFSWSEALSWQGSQSNCETKMPQQGLLCQPAPQMIKTETPKAPGPSQSVLRNDKEHILAFSPLGHYRPAALCRYRNLHLWDPIAVGPQEANSEMEVSAQGAC